jgi:hypothetical protein
MNSSPEAAKKKVYGTPSLKTYGSLTEMTAASGKLGHLDGGTKKNKNKTA